MNRPARLALSRRIERAQKAQDEAWAELFKLAARPDERLGNIVGRLGPEHPAVRRSDAAGERLQALMDKCRDAYGPAVSHPSRWVTFLRTTS